MLFGDRRQELYRALARALIELVVEKSPKPLVLGTSVRKPRGWQTRKKKTVKEVDVNTFFVLGFGRKIPVGWDFFLGLFSFLNDVSFFVFSFWEATP